MLLACCCYYQLTAPTSKFSNSNANPNSMGGRGGVKSFWCDLGLFQLVNAHWMNCRFDWFLWWWDICIHSATDGFLHWIGILLSSFFASHRYKANSFDCLLFPVDPASAGNASLISFCFIILDINLIRDWQKFVAWRDSIDSYLRLISPILNRHTFPSSNCWKL